MRGLFSRDTNGAGTLSGIASASASASGTRVGAGSCDKVSERVFEHERSVHTRNALKGLVQRVENMKKVQSGYDLLTEARDDRSVALHAALQSKTKELKSYVSSTTISEEKKAVLMLKLIEIQECANDWGRAHIQLHHLFLDLQKDFYQLKDDYDYQESEVSRYVDELDQKDGELLQVTSTLDQAMKTLRDVQRVSASWKKATVGIVLCFNVLLIAICYAL